MSIIQQSFSVDNPLSLPSPPSPPSPSNRYPDFYHYRLLLFLTSYIGNHTVFTLLSNFFYSTVCLRHSSYCQRLQINLFHCCGLFSTTTMYGYLSPIDGDLACFQFGAFMSPVALNILVHIFLQTYALMLPCIPKCGIAGSCVYSYLTLVSTPKQFSKE